MNICIDFMEYFLRECCAEPKTDASPQNIIEDDCSHEKQDRYDIVTFLDVIVTLSSLRNAIVLFVSSLFRL